MTVTKRILGLDTNQIESLNRQLSVGIPSLNGIMFAGLANGYVETFVGKGFQYLDGSSVVQHAATSIDGDFIYRLQGSAVPAFTVRSSDTTASSSAGIPDATASGDHGTFVLINRDQNGLRGIGYSSESQLWMAQDAAWTMGWDIHTHLNTSYDESIGFIDLGACGDIPTIAHLATAYMEPSQYQACLRISGGKIRLRAKNSNAVALALTTGDAEVTDVICPAGSALTTGQYFTFGLQGSGTQYYAWYNVDAGGGDPAPAGRTGVEIAVSAADADTVVATATAAAIDALSGIAAVAAGATVTVTQFFAGFVDDVITDVDSGVITAITTPGTGSFDNAGDIIRYAAHGLTTGQQVQFITAGTIPTGLAEGTYYVSVIDANNFKLAVSKANATTGTAKAFTTSGVGTHSLNTFVITESEAFDMPGRTFSLQLKYHPLGTNKGTLSVWIDGRRVHAMPYYLGSALQPYGRVCHGSEYVAATHAPVSLTMRSLSIAMQN